MNKLILTTSQNLIQLLLAITVMKISWLTGIKTASVSLHPLAVLDNTLINT